MQIEAERGMNRGEIALQGVELSVTSNGDKRLAARWVKMNGWKERRETERGGSESRRSLTEWTGVKWMMKVKYKSRE